MKKNIELSDTALKGREKLKEFQAIFEPHITKYFEKQEKNIKQEFNTEYAKLALDVYKEITLRKAKRLRASFAYYVYKMYGGKDLDKALTLGIVIELMHANWLILDDFMDMSELRRGEATAHKILAKYYEDHNLKRLGAEHFGNVMATNIGVVGIFMATSLLLDLEIESGIIKQIAKNIAQKMEITAHGQITDIFNSVSENVSEELVFKMHKWKTGVYTYENPIHLGAILAGATSDGDEKLKKLSEYAIPGGISFQLQDDILGMFGDAKITGKSAMDDLKEGKYTLLIHKALENANQEQKEIISKYLGKIDVTPDEHEQVKKVIEETGSLKYSRDKAVELVKQAKESLTKNKEESWDSEGFDYLNNIADYVIERQV